MAKTTTIKYRCSTTWQPFLKLLLRLKKMKQFFNCFYLSLLPGDIQSTEQKLSSSENNTHKDFPIPYPADVEQIADYPRGSYDPGIVVVQPMTSLHADAHTPGIHKGRECAINMLISNFTRCLPPNFDQL